MLVFRRYIAVGAGVFFVFGCKLSAHAQKPTLTNLQKSLLPAPVQESFPPRSPSLPTAAPLLLAGNPDASAPKSAELTTAKDESVANRDNYQDDLDAWRYAEPLVSQIKQMDSEDEDPAPEAEEFPPSIPPEEIELAPDYERGPVPELLDPSDNPLRYPTEPNEVEIETVQPITLEQAIETALKNNRDYQATRLELERAQEVLREALAAQYPNLDLSVDLTRSDAAQSQLGAEQRRQQLEEQQRQLDPSFDDDIDREDTDTNFLDGNLQLNYDIYTGGLRPAQIRAAERQVRSSELQVEVIAENTRLDVTNNYYDLQNSDAEVNIAQAAVEDSTQTLRDAQLLEQAGLGTRFDVLQAEVELANANQALILAIANQRIASRQLAETLSLGPNVGLTTADEIEEAGEWNFSLEESIVLAFQNRAELEQFLVQREINRQQREIALAAIRPQLSLFAAYDVAEDLGDANTGFEDGYSVGARLQWRLYDGGAARARAAQSETDTDIDEVEFANQRDQVRFEVENAFFSLEANQENIRTSEQAVTLAEESLRLARLRFQAGVGTQTEVIDAQTALTEARGNFLTAIIDYNRSLNRLQRAVSNLPDNRLFDLP